ncbi:tripartite tricarboxylate transporter receptor family protein [Corynebacterium suranareeae]|uniref:Tripartite tricarboxylate transporter receptor family protein n=1 Tax=Corynebacterium suranareeae TaxID=2506452 RepID=A0A161JPU6_9CORY|nr:tripartite tricarboxylate transporter substrate-binding protein [Corynebacterium suranareeae]BAU97420.1 tripartite tricarboxylate transporter receptor family protein [Corynebacterium suranareeae]
MPDSPSPGNPRNPEKPPRTPLKTAISAIAALVGIGLVIAGVADASQSTSGANARSSLTLIAPAGAGGGWDGAARESQQTLRSEGIVNNPQVVNIPGAGGTIGLSQLSSMSGESTTVMVMGITMLGAININGSGVSIDDVTPIARLTDDYDVVVVAADSPINSVDDLVAEWKKDPSHFPFGGGSLGSLDQMIIAQLAQEAGIEPSSTNYMAHSGGAELATALLSGTIKASVSGFADFKDQIEAGRLKIIGVSAEQPIADINAPTLIEQGYDVSLTNWRGIVAPPGITDEERMELEEIFREMIATDTWRSTLERNQWTDTSLIGDDFAQNLQQETETVDNIWSNLGY